LIDLYTRQQVHDVDAQALQVGNIKRRNYLSFADNPAQHFMRVFDREKALREKASQENTRLEQSRRDRDKAHHARQEQSRQDKARATQSLQYQAHHIRKQAKDNSGKKKKNRRITPQARQYQAYLKRTQAVKPAGKASTLKKTTQQDVQATGQTNSKKKTKNQSGHLPGNEASSAADSGAGDNTGNQAKKPKTPRTVKIPTRSSKYSIKDKPTRRVKKYKWGRSEGYIGITLEKFHLYPKLPVGLRTRILKAAAVPRQICLHFKWMRKNGMPDGTRIAVHWQIPVPAILGVNQETRTLSKLFLTPLLPFALGGLTTWIHYDVDPLYFGRKILKDNKLLNAWFEKSIIPSPTNPQERVDELTVMCNNLRHVAINNLKWLSDLARIIGEFRSLQTITTFTSPQNNKVKDLQIHAHNVVDIVARWEDMAFERKQRNYEAPEII
jgi:hypothetical protein